VAKRLPMVAIIRLGKNIRRMKVTYPPGALCVRGGAEKKDQFGCSTWGRSYARHMWNNEKLRIETMKFPV
jgi:hypothetical protein